MRWLCRRRRRGGRRDRCTGRGEHLLKQMYEDMEDIEEGGDMHLGCLGERSCVRGVLGTARIGAGDARLRVHGPVLGV